jgi:hypothetical protein
MSRQRSHSQSPLTETRTLKKFRLLRQPLQQPNITSPFLSHHYLSHQDPTDHFTSPHSILHHQTPNVTPESYAEHPSACSVSPTVAFPCSILHHQTPNVTPESYAEHPSARSASPPVAFPYEEDEEDEDDERASYHSTNDPSVFYIDTPTTRDNLEEESMDDNSSHAMASSTDAVDILASYPSPADIFQPFDASACPSETCYGTTEDGDSTKKTMKRVGGVWNKFVIQLPTAFISAYGNEVVDSGLQYNPVVGRNFISFYMSSRQKASVHHIREASNFLQRRLCDKRGSSLSTPEGIVSGDQWVKNKKRSFVKAVTRERNDDLSRDVQAHLDNQIPRKQELQLIDSCYSKSVLRQHHYIAKSNLACGYTYSSQVGTRGSDNRTLFFSQGFIRDMEHLGQGDKVDHFIHVEGKSIAAGRVEYKAFATHRNPRMDASAHLGLNLLLRFNVMGEPFPDFLIPSDYALRPIFRSQVDYHKALPPDTMLANWNSMFSALGIVCPKVTHQPRVQTQQRMADKGVSSTNIERSIGYAPDGMNKLNMAQKQSYLNCPPVQFVAGAADGNPNDPGAFLAGWNIVVYRSEIECLVPYLYKSMDIIETAFHKCSSHRERESACLNQAFGALKAMERRVHSAVKLLASKPQDDRNHFLNEKLPIHKCWKTPILNHPFFSSVAFLAIADRVQGAQLRESMNALQEPAPLHRNWVKQEVTKVLLPKLLQTQQCTQSILFGQRALADRQDYFSKANLANNVLLARISMQLSGISQKLGIEPVQEEFSCVTPPESSATSVLMSKEATFSGIDDDDESTNHNSGTPSSIHGSSGTKRAYRLVDNKPFSTSNVTAEDYWNEWKFGVNEKPSLESLERKSTEWRSDRNKRFQRADGSFGTAIKVAWSKQKPIYSAIAYMIDKQDMSPSQAIQVVQDIFDVHNYPKSGKPDLNKCKPFLQEIVRSVRSDVSSLV